jgi:hypothetical protein
MNSKEQAMGSQTIVKMTDTTVTIRPNAASEEDEKMYTFDHCYFTDSAQEKVYEDLGRPLLVKAFDGFNGTIFAYGQTGSGKTFSMMGSDTNQGMVPRLNEQMWVMMREKLDQIAATAESSGEGKGDTQFMMTVSFLEVYNEEIKDLLNPKDKKLKVSQNPKMGFVVEGLCELIVRDGGDVLRLIEQGNAVRRVAATNMNEQSSRSHSLFTITIMRRTSTDLGNGVTREQIVKGA